MQQMSKAVLKLTTWLMTLVSNCLNSKEGPEKGDAVEYFAFNGGWRPLETNEFLMVRRCPQTSKHILKTKRVTSYQLQFSAD